MESTRSQEYNRCLERQLSTRSYSGPNVQGHLSQAKVVAVSNQTSYEMFYRATDVLLVRRLKEMRTKNIASSPGLTPTSSWDRCSNTTIAAVSRSRLCRCALSYPTRTNMGQAASLNLELTLFASPATKLECAGYPYASHLHQVRHVPSVFPCVCVCSVEPL